MSDETKGEVEQVWLQQAEEPDEQYAWFMCYLQIGFSRSVRKAFTKWVTEHEPEDTRGLSRLGKGDEGRLWDKAATTWEWRRRAMAFDEFSGREALDVVRQQQLRLKLLTVDAVDALIKNLENPRTAVTAATAILDRGGIPAKVLNENLNANVNVSADDMAKAAAEVEAWENLILKPSGSNADNQ